jgi:dihydroneopterin aldolase
MPITIDTYRIRLEGIRFRARHGASRAEQALPQDFVVHLEVELPIGSLPQRDLRRSVFDYDRLANMVVEEGTSTTVRLLETLGQRLLARVLTSTEALAATVTVKKFGPPTAASVDAASVELTARR